MATGSSRPTGPPAGATRRWAAPTRCSTRPSTGARSRGRTPRRVGRARTSAPSASRCAPTSTGVPSGGRRAGRSRTGRAWPPATPTTWDPPSPSAAPRARPATDGDHGRGAGEPRTPAGDRIRDPGRSAAGRRDGSARVGLARVPGPLGGPVGRGRLAAAEPPAPSGRDQQGTGQRADDAAGPQREAVSGEEADQQASDERTDEPGDDRHRPVVAPATLAEDELRPGADEHAERDDGEDEHRQSIATTAGASVDVGPATGRRARPDRVGPLPSPREMGTGITAPPGSSLSRDEESRQVIRVQWFVRAAGVIVMTVVVAACSPPGAGTEPQAVVTSTVSS